MGAVAQSVFKNGGKITAVVPEPMLTLSDEQLCEPTVVPDMHSRKRRMHDESDAFIVLPGGFGTMEEMLEMITWSQLNIHSKPIILVNTKNYFTPFDSWVKLCVKENFIKSDNANIFVLCESSKQVLDTLNKYKAPEARYVIHWKPSERDTLV
ncbi:cytokinin riboside 5'-monophosphate phosphoribohydrolase LOG [Mycotypha africana]|uniref:cytokinin riboside 5'-monophosphate phosphoribohydrolase LOG n=1 Tax=Mycotypha africana TaxID=64632 RepID=UPI002301C38B|nr:cytokinin riboside 5'-monophosphate phosphoribohydrolase LOG [Mycotypha africana]KAI8971549.1 cytokinin riboside 5'-monophosphate phosphoribohydrolase LOG [Mycotypha africana]